MNSIKFEEILQSIQSPVKGNPNLFIVWLIRHLCSCYFCNQIYNLMSNYFEGSFLWACGFLKMFFSTCFERFYFERERRVSCIWEKLWWWVTVHTAMLDAGFIQLVMKTLAVDHWRVYLSMPCGVFAECLFCESSFHELCNVCYQRKMQNKFNRHAKSFMFHPQFHVIISKLNQMFTNLAIKNEVNYTKCIEKLA